MITDAISFTEISFILVGFKNIAKTVTSNPKIPEAVVKILISITIYLPLFFADMIFKYFSQVISPGSLDPV